MNAQFGPSDENQVQVLIMKGDVRAGTFAKAR